MHQSKIEELMKDIGSSKHNKRMEFINKASRHDYTDYGGQLIKWLKSDVIESLSSRKLKRRKPLWYHAAQVLPLERIVDVCARNLVNGMFHDRKYQSVLGSITNDFEDECRTQFIRKYICGGKKKLRYIEKKPNPTELKRSLIASGKRKWNGRFYTLERDYIFKALNVICTHLILHEYSPVKSEIRIISNGAMRRKQRFLTMRDGVAEWIRDVNNTSVEKRPHWLPIIDKPLDWTSMYSGGYSDEINTMIFCDNVDHNFPLSQKWEKFLPAAQAANHIQAVPHRVNNWMFDLIKQAYLDKVEFDGFPAWSLVPLPTWEDCGCDGKLYGMRMGLAKEYNQSTKKAQHKVAQALSVTGELLNTDLYMPVKSDFRGRLYTIPKDVSYQSGDMHRGILSFKGDEATGGEEWIIRQMANLYGWDKKPIEERLTFADKKADLIKAVAENPMDVLRDWEEASDPWQFAAACKEWESRNDEGFRHTLPIGMDASCNGLQILSILSGCERGCTYTNVLPSDKPYDFYITVLDSVQKELESRSDTFAKRWVKFGISRATVKTPTLAFPYGGTMHSTIAHVLNWYNEESRTRMAEFSDGERTKASAYLAKIVLSSIYDNLPNVKWLMDWFKDVAKIAADANINPVWHSPSGMLVKQTCYAPKSVTTFGGFDATLTVNNTRKVNPRNHIKSIVPNFIHSIDSAILHEVVRKVSEHDVLKDAPFSSVHDCYNTTAPYATQLIELVRDTFAEVMSKPILENFRNDMIAMGLEDLPKLPIVDKIPLTKIKDSVYLFS